MASRLVTLYAIFAGVSITANLGTQWLCIHLYQDSYSISVSMLAGTAVGLVTKYVLDKRWIFRYQTANRLHELRTFTLYTVMGVATTVIFWGTEALFHLIFGTVMMRFVGAVIGLTAGYIVKYALDQRLVFVAQRYGGSDQ